ncbi:hydroxyacid dehydrogenase [Nonomuraea sp. NPDC059023]|uniref:hydroxyacid dehydrogenase n=1 Tax=unclassified Nonomuraea TaxID=2593643 RepID=UPI0036BC1EF1
MSELDPRPIALLVMEERRRGDVYPPEVLRDLDELVRWSAPPRTREHLAEDPDVLAEVEILLTGWSPPRLDATLLSRAPKLRAVLVAAGSVRPLTTPEFWAREIPIVSAASANAIPVAEFALAQILLALKQAHRIAREIRAERRYPHDPRVAGGYRSRVGLFGLGAIGRLVAAHLRNFDVEVLACDPVADPAGLGVRLVELPELFAACSVVSLHAPLLPETEGLVDGELLDLLEPGGTLINTARGALVDEPSLVDVLRRRTDLTAVLDVTWPEPPPPDSPLFTLPNVVLTAHVAGALGGERARMGELVVDELRRLAGGEAFRHAVPADRAHIMA